MSFEYQQTHLFDRWKKDLPNIVLDGVFNPELYNNSKMKVLFVLKEPHSAVNSNSWNLLDTVRSGEIKSTWSNIARWSEIINDLSIGKPSETMKWSDYCHNDPVFIREALNRISVMNLKKTAGGTSTNMKVLKQAVSSFTNYKLYFKEQFELYNPDLVLCCGSGVIDVFLELLQVTPKDGEWKSTQRDVWYFSNLTKAGTFQNIPVLSWLHPQLRGRARNSMVAFSLADAVSELAPWEKTS